MSKFVINHDQTYHNLSTIKTNKIPRVTSLGGFRREAGDITFNRTNGKFYFHNGISWVQISSINESVFKYSNSATTGRDLVLLNNSNSNYIGDEDFVVPTQGTESTDSGAPTTRMMFLQDTAAFRAGTVTGMQWDAVNRGQASASFGSNNTASGDYSTTFGQSCIAGGDHSVVCGKGANDGGNNNCFVFGGLTSTTTAITNDVFVIGNKGPPNSLDDGRIPIFIPNVTTSALPNTAGAVIKYLAINIGGTDYKIPLHSNS